MPRSARRYCVFTLLSCGVCGNVSPHGCAHTAATVNAFMDHIFAQISHVTFADTYWDKKPVVFGGHSLGRDYRHLFSAVELNEAILSNSSAPKRLQKGRAMQFDEDLRICNHESISQLSCAPPESPAKGDPSDSVVWRLRDLVEQGWTLVLNGFHLFWRSVETFVRELEMYFERPLNANLYITQGGFAGFALHFDDSDVFFVQISGRKHWRVWRPFVKGIVATEPGEESVRHFPNSDLEREQWEHSQKLLVDKILLPGDILYIPRGFLHQGSAVSGDDSWSVHLTINFVSPMATFEYFIRKTALWKMVGQPRPPGSASHTHSANFMPEPSFEQRVTRNLPLSFRRALPPRLSSACAAHNFLHAVTHVLHDLDPAQSKRRIEEHLHALPRGGFVSVCHFFIALSLTVLTGEQHITRRSQVPSVHFSTRLCVRSPVAARVVPAWLPWPNVRKNKSEAVLIHSELNTCGSKCGQRPWPPEIIAEPFDSALTRLLHTESNPSGMLRPSDFMATGAKVKDDKHDAEESPQSSGTLKIVQRLLELRVLVEQQENAEAVLVSRWEL